ncbi:MAG: PilN domain-containing protein [Gallionellaceae bacterium]
MSQQINLFNPVFMTQRKYFSVVTMLQAFTLIILGSALFYAYAVYQVNYMNRQLAETQKRYISEQAKLVRYKAGYSPKEAEQKLEAELSSAEARLALQHKLVGTLRNGAIGNTSGYSDYMSAFARQVRHGLWLTSFSIVGDAKQISISGAVLSPELLPAYISRLNHESVMRGKSFASLQMQRVGTEGASVEFTLQSIEIVEAEE